MNVGCLWPVRSDKILLNQLTHAIAPDKEEGQVNISSWKHVVYTIRSTSLRPFWWVLQNTFSWSNEKNINTSWLIKPSLAEHDIANSVDPDHLVSEEANWSGSALFVIKYVNFYQNPRSSNLIGWKLEVGMES